MLLFRSYLNCAWNHNVPARAFGFFVSPSSHSIATPQFQSTRTRAGCDFPWRWRCFFFFGLLSWWASRVAPLGPPFVIRLPHTRTRRRRQRSCSFRLPAAPWRSQKVFLPFLLSPYFSPADRRKSSYLEERRLLSFLWGGALVRHVPPPISAPQPALLPLTLFFSKNLCLFLRHFTGSLPTPESSCFPPEDFPLPYDYQERTVFFSSLFGRAVCVDGVGVFPVVELVYSIRESRWSRRAFFLPLPVGGKPPFLPLSV